ncbi:MAG: DUF3786 domain-containing protein [Deltaproteobacteria bacterium]|nr:DUF3786 domain-containing protein [Deltaproteobacteria bacterium]
MMQERRRKETFQGKSPLGQDIQVPAHYWDELAKRDPRELCRSALAELHPPEGLLLRFVNEPYRVDLREKSLKRAKGGVWEKVNYDLLELILLVYLLRAKEEGLGDEMVTVQQLKDALFFQGPHALHTEPLVDRYGRDREGFRNAALALGAELLPLADAACKIQVLPRVPVYYLLWEGDEEFEPRVSVLFDRSVEKHLTADAIWGLVTLVTIALVRVEETLTPSGAES